MWIPDFQPSAGLLLSAALAMATASPALAADKYVLGRCQVARPDDGAEIRPTYAADSYLYEYHRAEALRKKFSFDNEATKVTLLKAPAHGEVALADVPNVSNGQYHYIPNEGYVGRDRFAMQVEKDGVKVRIEYVMEVVPYGEHTTYRDENDVTHGLFCNPDSWKISQATPDASTADLAAWQRTSELSSLIANASQSLAGFQDLPGSAVGTTTGTGPTAQITLDPTAAGHGWYIDPTPLGTTDDYLPTSDANVWQAKPGTAADGKMDLLSVLLHEYGHALGLEHSADSADFMALRMTGA